MDVDDVDQARCSGFVVAKMVQAPTSRNTCNMQCPERPAETDNPGFARHREKERGNKQSSTALRTLQTLRLDWAFLDLSAERLKREKIAQPEVWHNPRPSGLNRLFRNDAEKHKSPASDITGRRQSENRLEKLTSFYDAVKIWGKL